MLGLQHATPLSKGPVSSPKKCILRTKSSHKHASQLLPTFFPVLLSHIIKSVWMIPLLLVYYTIDRHIHLFYFSVSIFTCSNPNYSANDSRLYASFFFSFFFFKLKTTAHWITFLKPSTLIVEFLCIWQCTSPKNVHIRHIHRRWKFCKWEENAVVGQRHCSGRCLQTSERLVSSWSDRMCHARLPEALWSLHLTSWKRYCCHDHVTCNTSPLHPRACVFFHLCTSQHAHLLLRVFGDMA